MDFKKVAIASQLLTKEAINLSKVPKYWTALAEKGAPVAAGVWEYGVKSAPWALAGTGLYLGGKKGAEKYKRYKLRKQIERARKMQQRGF